MKIKSIHIKNKSIGSDSEPFVIAEISGNHNQSIETAFKIVAAAAESGASAIKLQTYTPDTMTLNIKTDDFKITSQNSLWSGEYLYDLYSKAYTPWEWHKEIFDYAKELGLIAFSSPFDETAVEFLENLDVPCYKIASFENIDLPLIGIAAKTQKPLFISTGLAEENEIKDAVECARDNGCKDLILLKCTSKYPADNIDLNLATINDLKNKYKCWVGYSDHTIGTTAAVASIALGAVVVEKHLSLSATKKSVDSEFSANEVNFKNLCEEINCCYKSLGKVKYGPIPSEMDSLKFRRSIYVVKNIDKGNILTTENMKCIRPGYGLEPKYYNELIGKKVNCDLKMGTPMNLSYISNDQ